MTRIEGAQRNLDLNIPFFSDKYQDLANAFLQRYPVDQYALDHPVYQDLVRLHADLKDSYQQVDLKQVGQALNDRGIPTFDLNSKGEFKKLIGTILKNYTLQKVAGFLANRLG